MGRPPHGGDSIEEDGYRVIVRKVRHVLVQEAYLQQVSDTSNMRTDQ